MVFFMIHSTIQVFAFLSVSFVNYCLEKADRCGVQIQRMRLHLNWAVYAYSLTAMQVDKKKKKKKKRNIFPIQKK